jgi:hypothetical protein
MATKFTQDEYYKILGGWVDAQEKKGCLDVYTIPDSRVHDVFQQAETVLKNCFRVSDHSPIKVAAAITYATAKCQPLAWKRKDDPSARDLSNLVLVQIDNARLAMHVGCYMVRHARFDCAPTIDPPFEMKIPSEHFKNEFMQYLANQELTPQGIALVLELVLYMGNGSVLAGTYCDKIPPTANNTLEL